MSRLLAAALCLALTFVDPGPGRADPQAAIGDFVASRPADVAVQVLGLEEDGSATALVSGNETQPMPLASSVKIVVLAAYARAVAAGGLDPEGLVTLGEWDGHYQPGTDGGAHAQALAGLSIPATEAGRAVDPGATARLDDLARAMIEVSDNAAADVLMLRLGQDAIGQTISALGLEGQTMPVPISGLYAAWLTDGEGFLALGEGDRVVRAWALAAEVPDHPDLQEILEADPSRLPGPDLAIALQNTTPPMGTAADYAGLMGRVLSGRGLDPAELSILRRHLGWAREGLPDSDRAMFRQLYVKGGSFSDGVLTLNLSFDLAEGPRRSVSLFLRNIPTAEMPAITAGAELFAFRLAVDPAAREDFLRRVRP